MNTQDENRIDLLLSQIKVEKAPHGFEDSVMSRIEAIPKAQSISLIDRLLSYLLIVNITAVLAGLVYFIGVERMQIHFTGWTLSFMSRMRTDSSFFEPLVIFITHIPPMFILTFVILAFLLGAERVLLRKRQTNTFLNLMI